LPPGDLSGPLSPTFLQALGARTGRLSHTIDLLCVAESLPRRVSRALLRRRH
jgi:hypothetical protein